ncbi:THUMP domain-containing protein 1 [Lunasporangiospora selenospora]|uniref:THUMP domain-containing protein 1 n=1 Tax=Lunasporangiospora selenospora TaxID=979761 RepID=A0A9P6G296_9FUNG|nr:THUMP domain-containing protein 1 [Lunasporangiospora selenospora]
MGGNKRKGDGQSGGGKDKKSRTDNPKAKYLPGGFPIDPKMRGVIISCTRGRENQAGNEAIDLLSEYSQRLYGSELDAVEVDQEEEESIEDAIQREIAEMKKPKTGKKFVSLLTGTDCVVFIQIRDDRIDPSKLCHYLLKDLFESGHKRTRYCQRFVPVTETAYANMSDIEAVAGRVLGHFFHGEDQKATTFKVIPKIRHNNKVDRDLLLRMLASIVGQKGSHKVELEKPEQVILVEVIKSICFISVVRDYDLLRKYNIQSVFEESQKPAEERGSAKSKPKADTTEETKSTEVEKDQTEAKETQEKPVEAEKSAENAPADDNEKETGEVAPTASAE